MQSYSREGLIVVRMQVPTAKRKLCDLCKIEKKEKKGKKKQLCRYAQNGLSNLGECACETRYVLLELSILRRLIVCDGAFLSPHRANRVS